MTYSRFSILNWLVIEQTTFKAGRVPSKQAQAFNIRRDVRRSKGN